MDPDTCLSDIINAAVSGDATTLMDLALEMAAWIRKGGFTPTDPRLSEEE